MAGSDLDPKILADARKSLLTPVESKEALRDWIGYFLGVELPDGHVAVEGPNPSTCSPMEMAWRVYDACRRNDTAKMSRALAYASRDSFKSLTAAALEVLAVLHLRRPTAHAAAQESQTKNVQRYVKEFFERPLLRDLKKGDSIEETSVLWYERRAPDSAPLDPPLEVLFESEWKLLSVEERERYVRVFLSINVMTGTVRSMNSWHGPFCVLDEVDLFDPAAYKQARMMPAPYGGFHPFTLLISTRKSSIGLVQHEVDVADKSGLAVWHWNIIDVTDPCPPERHLPDEPMVAIYRKDDDLAAISEAEFEALPEDDRDGFEKDEGYAGCLKNCKLWVGCRGTLASKPPFDVGVSMLGRNQPTLRPIENTQDRFVTNAADNEDFVKSELFCWKASSEAAIYRRYDERKHRLTAAQIWERVSGEKADPRMGRAELVIRLLARGAVVHAGYDWGYTHNFVPVVAFMIGHSMYVLFCWALGEMDDPQKVDFCKRHFGHLNPIGWPDPEAPNTIKLFKKSGFKMRDWQKGQGSVVGGIQVVRRALWPGPQAKEPLLYFLAGDPGVDHLCNCVKKWEWVRDRAGVITDEPSEKLKDENDALRYMVMNAMKLGGRGVRVSDEDGDKKVKTVAEIDLALRSPAAVPKYTRTGWAKAVIAEAVASGDGAPPEPAGHKGRFRWSF